MSTIKIAIVGVGNCASSLIQGTHYYRGDRLEQAIGLMHEQIGPYRPEDIQVVAAFDIDRRKVGKDVNEAIFAKPNCTTVFHRDLSPAGVTVGMGQVLDGLAEHLEDFGEDHRFVRSDAPEPTKQAVVDTLRSSGAEILCNYLPVGSEQATRFYADCALDAGVGFINNVPVFIASDPEWAGRFEARGVPVIGDDIKSQLGATIAHRTLIDLFHKRGVKLNRTYQLNTGGNTDFLNMLCRSRLASKKRSKTEAVQSVTASRVSDEDIHVGPSDYVAWQKDNKIAYIRMEGSLFGNVPMNLEMRLSVEDSPNSAGVAIDAIRCAKLALDRAQGGVLTAPSAYLYKHPPRQFTDDEAFHMMERFIVGRSDRRNA